MERKAPRKIFAEMPKEKRNVKPKSRTIKKANFDVYEHISSKRFISTAEFNNFLRVLKLDLRSGAIEREEYDYYARMANKKHENHLRKNIRKESEEPMFSEESYKDSSIKESKLKELEERKLEEKKLAEKEAVEENHGRMPFLKKMFAFFKQPGARILIFIILAAFLLYYLTRSTMSDVVQNPSILVVVVLIIIVILGRGGKTRTYEPSMF